MTAAVSLDGVGLWVAPPRVTLLHDVSWVVQQGEHWAVLGPNGAGKTSLLSIVAGNRFPSAGTVEVLGATFGRVDLRVLRERIATVDAVLAGRFAGQLPLVDVALTGASGTVLPRYELYTSRDRDRALAELDVVGLEPLQDRQFRHCSQGERARAMLARALVQRPDLLVLDEASTGLDLPAREALIAALAGVCRDRPELTTITVTHHVEELPPTTTHALLLRGGVVVAAGPVGEVLVDAALSETFGIPVRVRRDDGRWTATAGGRWRP